MAKYNFTVRAEDNQGAFADRTFNIEVQNNLVDRIAATDGTHVYSSIDGTTWTQRTGKGDSRIYYLNGKWVVMNAGTYLRIKRVSSDCINWTETTSGVMKIVSGGVTEDISHIDFPHSFKHSYIENGYVYMYVGLALVSGNSYYGIVRTNDFITYEVCGYSGSEPISTLAHTAPFTEGLPAVSTWINNMSNIVKKDDQYIFTISRDRTWWVTNSLDVGASWSQTSQPATWPTVAGYSHPILYNINGFIVIFAYNQKIYADALTSYGFVYMWTYDLVNFNDSGMSPQLLRGGNGQTVAYNNGVFCSLDGGSKQMFYTETLDTFLYGGNTIPDSDINAVVLNSLRAVEPYKGEFVMVDSVNNVFMLDQFSKTYEKLSYIAASGTIDSIAVMK